ncbi:ABC transporter ATP-binding protein [Pseudoroseicyclus sp. H15]
MTLVLEGIGTGYGQARVLEGVSLTVAPGEVLAVMGRNGVGKTTLLRAIMGVRPLWEGRMSLEGKDLTELGPEETARAGIAWVPQGRRLFGDLTVAENIEVGLMTRRSPRSTRDEILTLFPRLKERLGQRAGTLSGGEQQMLAIARALAIRPAVLLLDEPTEGLQPSIIAQIREVILRLKGEGVAVLLVEQRVDSVLQVADRVAFLSGGGVGALEPRAALAPGAPAFARYVGV